MTKYKNQNPETWTQKTDVFGNKIAVFSGINISDENFFMSNDLETMDGFLLYQCRLLANRYIWPSSMRCLYLMHTHVSHDQLKNIATSHNLKYFKALDASLDDQALMELTALRPELKII